MSYGAQVRSALTLLVMMPRSEREKLGEFIHAGELAWNAQVPFEKNPHSPDTVEWAGWLVGWDLREQENS
jgi:hypothetical protein